VVVGVLEPSVPYPTETEIFANVVTSPHHLSATMVTGREHRMTELFSRLASGADVESARRAASGARRHRRGTSNRIRPSPTSGSTRSCCAIRSRRANRAAGAAAASGLVFVITVSNVVT
jgi:hypothetical protein